MVDVTGTANAVWRALVPRWRRYAPPARPSAEDVAVMRERLTPLLAGIGVGVGDREARVLVLGSTPELRGMLAELPGVRVTIIDCVLPMMLAMTELMAELVDSGPLDEVWIKGDWLTAPLPERYFDAVVSQARARYWVDEYLRDGVIG